MNKILNETIIKNPNEKEYFGFIYITHNKIKNKYYIGKCKYNRRNSWKQYYGSGKYLRRAIDKYGIENFERYIIKECKTEEELNFMEEFYIDKYKAYEYGNNFYNISNCSSGGFIIKGYSEEQMKNYKIKMSKIMKEKSKDKNYINNVSIGVKNAFKREETKINHSNGQKKKIFKYRRKEKII